MELLRPIGPRKSRENQTETAKPGQTRPQQYFGDFWGRRRPRAAKLRERIVLDRGYTVSNGPAYSRQQGTRNAQRTGVDAGYVWAEESGSLPRAAFKTAAVVRASGCN